MSGTDGELSAAPLMQPYLVEFLKDRPRVIDKGVRRDFLDQLSNNIRERRRPDTMAEKTVRNIFEQFEDAGSGVARERMRKRIGQVSEGPLENF